MAFESKANSEVILDQRDKRTPDHWIKRHPELIRLTGSHPFNSEPSPSRLHAEGHITPNALFYVRNHGIVPRLSWDTHTLEVTGMVSSPKTFTMNELAAFPSRQFPVTFACAGNRRREVNLVKQSKGFNWGSAAVSTSVFGGVMLCELLRACGVHTPDTDDEEWYVHFEGSDELPNGTYATSIRYSHVMNPANEVLIAYQMNGQQLPPDHGYPIRLLMPGFIGGRMVKWLKRITVAKQESDNWYHIHDNRIIPTNDVEDWWRNPDTVINSLNINSAIAYPQNDEFIPLSQDTYLFRGYAYTGSGNKIIRVELSMDGGESWLMSTLEPQIPSPISKKYWSWARWSYDLPVRELSDCKEIVVRAWDATYNTQPSQITWNVLGQMNNAYFRLKVTQEEGGNGKMGYRMEHPCVAGNQEGGWMHPSDPTPATAFEPTPNESIRITGGEKSYSHNEIKEHNKPDDCWVLINEQVYDVTKFIAMHPGGRNSIEINAGSDCTEDFESIHSSNAHNVLHTFYIGELRQGSADETIRPAAKNEPDDLVALSPREYREFPLMEKVQLNHNTRLFRFKLPTAQHRPGLPIGSHILLRSNIGTRTITRTYTPTSTDNEPGHIDLIVKVYFPNVSAEFPCGGLMSQHLDSLQIGETVEMKGLIGHFAYNGNGLYSAHQGKAGGVVEHIGMIAGGSGITPMYQVIKSILQNPQDPTRLSLIFANRTDDDVILYEELNNLVRQHPDQLTVCYTVSESTSASWTHSIGPVDHSMCQRMLPNPGERNTIVLLCGPPGMIQHICIPNLEKLQLNPSSIITL
ncbi:nitrate reductase [Basidiobolus meristosporus CBS 931.73]|uniref:Nitrate reductase [NADPH] n=1 Tax=Basidiobolus meristosporus CBS 931.73 TaxID=1314790 RepID=A0A1Y1XDW8_9FUNG|nr:nitrate reductase [Basidiobolus meristosporus CBS 931.73]|eukprot:ORX83907.1 nitrate reductase [Basidiobolus meristosporus CBS 931.73]